jgi:hypothetical protein
MPQKRKPQIMHIILIAKAGYFKYILNETESSMPSTLEDFDGNCSEICSMICLPLEGILVVMRLRDDVGSRRIVVYNRKIFSNVNTARDFGHIHWSITGCLKPISSVFSCGCFNPGLNKIPSV